MTKARLGNYRLFLVCLAVGASSVTTAGAQSNARSAPQFQPPSQLFSGLFGVRAVQNDGETPSTSVRERSANRRCPDCQSRPGFTHVLFDSPRISDEWLSHHTYNSGATQFGDNAAIADFWYDAVHRRIHTRSAAFHEVDDPADVRLGRAPGTYPDNPDFSVSLGEGTTVGHVGFESWTPNGFGAYFAAMQGAVRDGTTGYLDFATATGLVGRTRTGSRYNGEDLIKHLRLHPNGQLEVGFETDPNATPNPLLMVRGNQQIEGALIIEKAGGNVPHSCSLRQFMGSGRAAAVSGACAPGEVAIAGGGSCSNGNLQGSFPTRTSAGVNGWEIQCTKKARHDVYVVCCAQ